MLAKKNAVVEMPADAGSAAGGSMQYAGFWARVAAVLVDSAILTIAGVVLVIVLSMALGGAGAVIANLVFLLAYLLYWPVLESSGRQATFGKQLLGIQVTDVNGNRTSFVKALLRNLAKIVSAIPFYIGFLLAAFTGRKQALHDMITGCLVVRTGPSSLMKAVGAAVGGLAIAGIAGYYYITEVFFAQVKQDVGTGMEQAMKGAQKDMQREMEKAMKEAEKQMKKDMEKAMAQAQKGAPSTPVAAPASPAPPAATVTPSTPPSPAPQKPASVALAPTPAQPAAPVMKEAAAPTPAPEMAPAGSEKPKARRRVATRKPAAAPAADRAPAAPPRAPKYNDVMSAVMLRDGAGAAEVLELGFWADRPDPNGVTPLMAAAMNGDAAIAQLLLKHGADPNRHGPAGSVLDYAMRGRDSKLIALLKQAGAR
jgi:uncharacterized RDD family membrane protein YckC